jgi:hypothetical protein
VLETVRLTSTLRRRRLGIVLIIGWLPFVLLGVLLTLSIWIAVVGVPLLFFAGAGFASGVRLVRNREEIRGQHAVPPLISALLVAAILLITLSADGLDSGGRRFVAIIAAWVAVLVVAAVKLLVAWRMDLLAPPQPP